ncbi:hypothetical protein [Myxococcus phage Mx1]|nr:hypothetical protein [Myxococcus phage Mx1]
MNDRSGLSPKILARQSQQWEAYRQEEARRIAAEDAVYEAILKARAEKEGQS